MLRRDKVGGWSDFSNYSDYLKFAQKQAGAKGNAPGFNSQFQYPDGASTNVNWEYIDGNMEGGRALPQMTTQRKLMTGNYNAMVPDVPFDMKAHTGQKKNLAAYGFAALVVGFFLLSKTRG